MQLWVSPINSCKMEAGIAAKQINSPTLFQLSFAFCFTADLGAAFPVFSSSFNIATNTMAMAIRPVAHRKEVRAP